MSSFFPPQIGFIPTGTAGTQSTSTIYLGQNVSVTWDSVGFGQNGRPDYLETLYINMSDASNQQHPAKIATLKIDVADIQSIITTHGSPTGPAGDAALTFQIREVLVCDAGVAKNMMILASATYPTGVS